MTLTALKPKHKKITPTSSPPQIVMAVVLYSKDAKYK